ncbi:hypothetical protein PG993_009784 [Apiospora rasikravindrae]|uniref:Uncharacterized protein n=1 Tax=Apiospora rasikravindrae TaxID=990691 RepID=A0ABR1SM52_9PEZI
MKARDRAEDTRPTPNKAQYATQIALAIAEEKLVISESVREAGRAVLAALKDGDDDLGTLAAIRSMTLSGREPLLAKLTELYKPAISGVSDVKCVVQ